MAIIPPAPGVTPPANFHRLKSTIESSYKAGYYAEKTQARKALLEKIAKGELKNARLAADSVFALTLLGNYTDLSNHYSPEDLQQKLFDGPSPTGTITDYYSEISYNQMHFTGRCNGWFKVSGSLASYVGSDNGLSSSGGPKFVYDLIRAADNTVNFSSYIQYYDGNNTPHIGFIAAIHAGADAAAGANNIWSHRWNFRVYSGSSYTTNDIDPVSGKKVIIDGDYAIEPELKGAGNGNGPLIDIGVFAHEFGHIFGLPDLYDTDNTSEGIGQWCLMASGSYGGNGQTPQTPVHMSAWCKKEMGWVTPIDLDSLHSGFTLRPAETTKDIYRVWKHGASGSNEYFLIENRQAVGFDSYIPIDGVLIFHVDDNMGSNTNENHYLVDLMQADGRRDLNRNANRGDAGDPFPGLYNKHNFGANTTPSSVSYTAGPTYVFVRNIFKAGENYTMDIDNGTEPNVAISNMLTAETTNQNGRVEQNENGSVIFSALNIGSAAYSNFKISVSFSDPLIAVKKPSLGFSLAAAQNAVFKFDSVFYVPSNFTSKMLYMHYTVTCGRNVIKDSAKIALGIPNLLLINKSDRADLNAYYEKSFDSLGLNYEESGFDGTNYLYGRRTVVIISGRMKDTLFSQKEIDSLSTFVSAGGCLLLSGQNLAEFLNVKYPDFLHNIIGVNWVKNESVFKRTAYKVPGDFLGDKLTLLKYYGTDGAANENSPDMLSPYSPSFHTSLSYRTDSVECAGGWRALPNGGKVVIFGFGIESINSIESAVTRTQAIKHIFDWFNGLTSMSSAVQQADKFTLSQNYPNPFNPSTVITYSLPERSTVRLTVYNILGKEITRLVEGSQSAGDHSVLFDASRYASGVYYYALTFNGSTITRKMILIK